MTAKPQPTAKAIRDDIEAPTIWGAKPELAVAPAVPAKSGKRAA